MRATREDPQSTPTLPERLHSLRHGFSLWLSERLRRTRGVHRETPAHALPALAAAETAAIEALRRRYGAECERHRGATTALRSYEYLDILHRAFAQAGVDPPTGGALCDVGSANFWYARALSAFFRPTSVLGVEVEGYRRYKDGRSRHDYAAGYLADLPAARFEIADYTRHTEPADLITAWFPFVSTAAILAWRLPLGLLQPAALFGRVRANLTPRGAFLMVNHGEAEARTARALCDAAGLGLRFIGPVSTPLAAHRARRPVVSLWCRDRPGPAG